MGYGSKDKNMDNRHHSGAAVQEALNKCQEILALIEDEVSEKAKIDRAEFFESVTDGVKGVHETIERENKVTDRQQRALDGWEGGVRKFIR